jgi:hypothetical protein
MIGYPFFTENGFSWRENQKTIVPISMPHCDPEITDEKARMVLRERSAFLIRWDDDFDQFAVSEWWHVIKSGKEDILDLPKKTRYMIRKASKTYISERCSRETIEKKGYRVYCAAYQRYVTHERKYTENEFISAIKSLPKETEFWAVFDVNTSQIMAFSENLLRDSACFYVSMWLVPDAMKKFAGYLLFHEMNKFYLNDKELKYISDGARSISHQTNIHEFLRSKFGFRKAYSRLRVVYAPGLSPVIAALYPFRAWIKKMPGTLFQKISVVLEQERIRRACERLPEVV